MTKYVVDTNPLVYIYHAVPGLGEEYAVLLGECARKSTLFIPKIVYGELSLMFGSIKELNSFLNDTGIVIGEIRPETYAAAAQRWARYNKHRLLMCSRCGHKLAKQFCSKCNSEIRIRQHILSDFLIGAYALQVGGRNLITHDAGYYKSYFKELNIVGV